MVQGVLSEGRVRLLVSKGSSYYRPRKVGERKRKSIRGCTVAADIKILNLSIIERGAEDLPGLTDGPSERPKRLGPKRATRIRKIFGLTKSEDIRKKITVREFTTKKGKTIRKRPKIQRLVTPLVLQRKRALRAEKREAVASAKKDEAEYKKLKAVRASEHRASTKARRSSRKSSKKEESSEASKA
jgi:small subunit ribosomal protein S6e